MEHSKRSETLKNIQQCLHSQISTNEKPCCINCGLVQETVGKPYIRSISHYKELYRVGIIIPVSEIMTENLKIQVIKFNQRRNKPEKRTFMSPEGLQELEVYRSLYLEYIEFLRDNQDRVLPKKPRKRQICQIYGEHRKILLEYIFRLVEQSSIVEYCK